MFLVSLKMLLNSILPVHLRMIQQFNNSARFDCCVSQSKAMLIGYADANANADAHTHYCYDHVFLNFDVLVFIMLWGKRFIPVFS